MSTLTRYNNLTAQNGAVILGWAEGFSALESLTGSFGFIFDLAGLRASRLVRPTGMVLTTNLLALPASDTVSLYVVDEANPVNYDNAHLPGQRGEAIPENLIWQFQGLTNLLWQADVPIFYEFGKTYSGGMSQDSPTLMANWQRFWARRIAREDWSGRLAISHQGGGLIRFYAAEMPTESLRPQIEVLEWGRDTGHADWPLDRGRSLHDMRSGLPAMAGELVEDGFSPGVWVRPDHWDDEDRRGEATLPSGEGVVRDKVPQ